MATGIATAIMMTVVLQLPERAPIVHFERIDNISLCWAMAREIIARAEEGILRETGGELSVSCKVKVPPSVTH